MKFAHIGMNNVVQTDRVKAIIMPKTKTANRILETAKANGSFIDASRGRSHRALLILDDWTVIASCKTPETLTKRFNQTPEELAAEYHNDPELELLEADGEGEEE